MNDLISTLEKEPKSIYSIRFQDCDPMGHLNNSRYIDYFLNAREDHLDQYYNMRLSDFIAKGQGWVIANHDAYYLKPAYYNEKICIQTSLIDFGDHDIVVEGLMMNEAGTQSKLLIWTRYIYVDPRTGKRNKHPQELMEMFAGLKNEKVNTEAGVKARLQGLLERNKII